MTISRRVKIATILILGVVLLASCASFVYAGVQGIRVEDIPKYIELGRLEQQEVDAKKRYKELEAIMWKLHDEAETARQKKTKLRSELGFQ